MVRLPRCLSAEFSRVLGTVIADRLPTREARPWRKALAPWEEYLQAEKGQRLSPVPDVAWPIKAMLFVHPGKLTYGEGESILWELALLGESADHGRFLEIILPAMEQAATTTDPRWYRQNNLWGRFDIQAVYVARGRQWEPIVQVGQLDLRYRATTTQWAEGLAFEAPPDRIFDHLTWITPFDFGSHDSKGRRRKRIPARQVPTLQHILEALVDRMSTFLPGKYNTAADVRDSLDEAERTSLQAALEQAALIPVHHHDLKPAPRNCPGRWIGTQTFPSIPTPIIPYLELAAILHVGKQTHFGCGTFTIG